MFTYAKEPAGGFPWPGGGKPWPELWRNLAEVVPDCLFIVGRDGTILYLNREEAEAPDRPVCGTRVFEHLPDALSGELRESLDEVFRGAGGHVRTRQVAVTSNDGRERWYVTQAGPVYRDGQVVAAALVARDVTEARLMVLGRLGAGIAHDVQNILMVIRASVEVLREELPGGHPLRLDVEWINDAVSKGAALTSQLLALARQEEREVEDLDLNTLVRNTLGLLQRLLGARVKVVTRLEPRGTPVRADRSQLEQVLFNLVLNARDAMPQGGKLTVSTTRLPPRDWALDAPCVVEGPMVRLRVEDTGVGMDAATRQQSFTPFFTTKAGMGSGLGLSIVGAVVKRAGGCVEVESQPGQGTIFDVLLPDAEAVLAAQV